MSLFIRFTLLAAAAIIASSSESVPVPQPASSTVCAVSFFTHSTTLSSARW